MTAKRGNDKLELYVSKIPDFDKSFKYLGDRPSFLGYVKTNRQWKGRFSKPDKGYVLVGGNEGFDANLFFMYICRTYDDYLNLVKKALAPVQEPEKTSWLRRVYNAIRRQKSEQ